MIEGDTSGWSKAADPIGPDPLIAATSITRGRHQRPITRSWAPLGDMYPITFAQLGVSPATGPKNGLRPNEPEPFG